MIITCSGDENNDKIVAEKLPYPALTVISCNFGEYISVSLSTH